MPTCGNSANYFGWLGLISDLLNAIFNWGNGYIQHHLLKMSGSLYKYDLGFGLGGKKTSGHKNLHLSFFLSEDSYDVVKRAFNLDSKVS